VPQFPDPSPNEKEAMSKKAIPKYIPLKPFDFKKWEFNISLKINII
jgi:hypothetical protein